MKKVLQQIVSVSLVCFLTISVYAQPPIAEGQDKFLGNVYSYSQVTDFTKYWNQVTPENGGKWGSVERTQDVMSWSELDNAYNLAKNNGFPFRMHVMIWGNQQPGWIELLDSAQQREEIEEWFFEVSNRYSGIDMVEVVNEPLHDPPSGSGNGNYIKALGGNGTTGWDWVINAFKLGRQYFPNSELMLNDYGIIGNLTAVRNYIKIVKLLQADTLIDGLCFQAHAFTTKGASASTMQSNLDTLAKTGLPIYVTELDIDGPSDLVQINEYQRVFPVFWEHPAVHGITLWGWRPGLWRNDQKAYIVSGSGTERPAMKWLKAYVNDTFEIATDLVLEAEGGIAGISTKNGQLTIIPTITPLNATINNISWSVDSSALGSVSSKGIVTALSDGILTVTATLLDGSGLTESIDISISNQNVPSDITDVSLSGNCVVYPNPAVDNFSIETIENITSVKIFNIAGELVENIDVAEENKVLIKLDRPKGLYLIKVSTLNNTYFHKVTLQ